MSPDTLNSFFSLCIGFAIAGEASGPWALAELLQALGLGAMGVIGLHRSPYWLAAGWALHPIWDVPLHYFGGGHEFAPESWAIACVSFDWIVALYIVAAYWFTSSTSFANPAVTVARTLSDTFAGIEPASPVSMKLAASCAVWSA